MTALHLYATPLTRACRTPLWWTPLVAPRAAEMGISHVCASKWVNRYRRHGELGVLDRTSTPRRQPTATDADVVARIDTLRHAEKWSVSRIAFELQTEGVSTSRRTVSRHLLAPGLNRRRFIDPSGESNRELRQITGRPPRHMVHKEAASYSYSDENLAAIDAKFANVIIGSAKTVTDRRR